VSVICVPFDNENICSGGMLYTCRASARKLIPRLNDTCRQIMPEIKEHQGGWDNCGKYVHGCLYVLSVIVPPDIRRAVTSRTERYKLCDVYTITQRVVGEKMTVV